MIKLRLQGTPTEVKQFAQFVEQLCGVRVLERSDPYSNRGKSAYQRIYMDVELKPSPATGEILLGEDDGECPYKGTLNGKEVCTISLAPTNGAVQCDFEFENCQLYQYCEHYKKLEKERNE